MVYLPVEAATGDYYGGYRPGDNLFAESLVAVDLYTGERRWHFQLVHHGIWDHDIPCAPILLDLTIDGEIVKAVAQPTKQAFLYVFNRETGEPIWPIEERPVEAGDVPRRVVLAHAAVSDEAARLRPAGGDAGRPDRLHPRSCAPPRSGGPPSSSSDRYSRPRS